MKNNFSLFFLVEHRGQIFKISKVDASVDPPMYELSDLLDTVVPGRYYQEQLKLSPDPNQKDYWTVDKVLKTRRRKGKTEHLVKFLYYPGKLLFFGYLIEHNSLFFVCRQVQCLDSSKRCEVVEAMSNPLKSFVLSSNPKEGKVDQKINIKYANIFVGVWQISLIDFFVKFSKKDNKSVVLTVTTNLVCGENFDLKGQTVNQDVTIRCVGLPDNVMFHSFNFQPLWFTVNAPSDVLQIKIRPTAGKLEGSPFSFVCGVVLQRVA